MRTSLDAERRLGAPRRVRSESFRKASAATSGSPLQTAASISSTSVQAEELQLVDLAGSLGSGQRLFVATEAVVQHCAENSAIVIARPSPRSRASLRAASNNSSARFSCLR